MMNPVRQLTQWALVAALLASCSSSDPPAPTRPSETTATPAVVQPDAPPTPQKSNGEAAPNARPSTPSPEAPPSADEVPARYDLVRDHLRLGRADEAMAALQSLAKAGAVAREILAWARNDEDLLPLRDRPEYQALMYPEGERPAGQVPISRLYGLGGPARLTHRPDGPILELNGLGEPPTEGERFQPLHSPGWAAFKKLLGDTRAISGGDSRSYQTAPRNRHIDRLPLAVRQGGVSELYEIGWWRPRENQALLAVPYQLAGAHGGLGVALYARAPPGVQLAAASGEIPLQCEGHEALMFTSSFEEIRLISGCHGATLTVCRLRWEAGAVRSACEGMPDDDVSAAPTDAPPPAGGG